MNDFQSAKVSCPVVRAVVGCRRGASNSAMRRIACALIGASSILTMNSALAQGSFGPYVPTPSIIVDKVLEMGAVNSNDYLIDLGSGDGRIVITAAKKHGARGLGIDIQEKLVELAAKNANAERVADRVKFVRGDIMEADLSQATVITTYLLPSTITKLVPKFLKELKPGTRIVSHDYPISPLVYERVVSYDFEEKRAISGTTLTVVYLYLIPARVDGIWNMNIALPGAAGALPLRLEQKVESLAGSIEVGGARLPLRDLRLSGEEISFAFAAAGSTVTVRGRVKDGEMTGSVVSGLANVKTWTAQRR